MSPSVGGAAGADRLAVAAVMFGAGLFVAIARYPELEPISRPEASGLDPEAVGQGEVLADIGACAVWHTAEGGEAFAGGRAFETPFGVLHSTNITPDPETGIGAWSFAAFERSMREGVDRSGTHLYPVFPYTHFARVSPEDMEAIYAFLMSQEAVVAEALPNRLRFPANVRPLLAGWKLLCHDAGPFVAEPERTEAWNRGAYLAEGLGHCSICHSPLGRFGAVVEEQRYSGGSVEGWRAPALNDASPAPIAWGDPAMVNYLLDGWDIDHGVAADPMQPVVNHLGAMSEDDAFAMAEYLVSLRGEAEDAAREAVSAFAESR